MPDADFGFQNSTPDKSICNLEEWHELSPYFRLTMFPFVVGVFKKYGFALVFTSLKHGREDSRDHKDGKGGDLRARHMPLPVRLAICAEINDRFKQPITEKYPTARYYGPENHKTFPPHIHLREGVLGEGG